VILKQLKSTNFFILCLIVVGFIIYGHTLWFSYSPLDDYELFVKRVDWFRDISNLPGLFTSSIDQSVSAPFYRPMLMMSFAMDSILGKGSLLSFHLTNLLIHISVSILVFLLFRIVTNSRKTGFFWGLLFLVHPVHVQAVTWIPGRNDTLLTLYALIAVIALFRYCRSGSNGMLAVNIVSFILAMYTKEQGVLLMFIFGVIIFNSKYREQILPLSFIWFISCFLFIIPRKLVMTGGFIFSIASYYDYFTQVMMAFIISIGKLVIPLYQSVFPSVIETPLWPGLLVIIMIILAYFSVGVRNKRIFTLGLFWFLVMSALPLLWGSLEDEHFEHRLYLSSIGFFLLISQLNIWSLLTKKYPRILQMFLVVILISFGAKTWIRSHTYRNEMSFAISGVEESPLHAKAHYLLGNVYKSKKDWQQAVRSYDQALEINPMNANVFNNRGDTFLQLKVFEIALEDFNSALAINPDNLEVRNNRAVAYYFLQEYDLAWTDVQLVLANDGKVHPDFLLALEQKLSDQSR